MHKAHVGEEEWGHSEFQSRRDEIKQRKLERRQRKMTKRREKRETFEGG